MKRVHLQDDTFAMSVVAGDTDGTRGRADIRCSVTEALEYGLLTEEELESLDQDDRNGQVVSERRR